MKSMQTKAAADLSEFFVGLRQKALKKGVTDEQFGKAILKDSVQEKMIDAIFGASKTVLTYLKLIVSNIVLQTELSQKIEFWRTSSTDGPIRLWLSDNFVNWIMKSIPDIVPPFSGALMKTQLTKNMYDSEILEELDHPKPFTVAEFAGIVRDLLLKQPNGEDGLLIANGYANIFYVQLEGRVVAVDVYWNSESRGWGCDAYGLDDAYWSGGSYVFSRS